MDILEEILSGLDNRKLKTEKLTDTDVTIKMAFSDIVPDFKFDKRLCKRIIDFYQRIKTSEHNISWFGGCLLGTDNIRFTDRDRDYFFDEVLCIDEDYLENRLEKTGLNQSWDVTSDTLNVAFAWLIHKGWEASPGFKDKNVKEALIAAISIWQFKFYSSLYFGRFSAGRNADMPAATAAYAALSLKYAIKQLGSWQAALEYRSERFLQKDSPHYKQGTYEKFDDINGIIYIISDLNTRVRKTFYTYYGELDKIRKSNARVGSYGDNAIFEGEIKMKDMVSVQETSMRYLLSSSTNTNSFISSELVDLVNEIVSTASPVAVRDTLIGISNLPMGKERIQVEKIMEKTLLVTFDYIQKNQLSFRQITLLLEKIRGVLTSAKGKDPDILFIRAQTERLVSKFTNLRHGTTLAACRTAILLYFILKGLSGTKK